MDTKQKLFKARELIKTRRYDQARVILEDTDHPKAWEWLDKINEMDLGDPFADVVPTRLATTRRKTPPPSYTDKAILVIVLYFVLFLPGLLASFMWRNEARQVQERYIDLVPGLSTLERP